MIGAVVLVMVAVVDVGAAGTVGVQSSSSLAGVVVLQFPLFLLDYLGL